MQIEVLKSKIYWVTATEVANLIEGEKTRVMKEHNGARLETYATCGTRNNGEIILNGPTACKAQKGDIVIILSYAGMDVEEAKKFTPTLIFLNEQYNTLN